MMLARSQIHGSASADAARIEERIERYVTRCLDGGRDEVSAAGQGGRDGRLLQAAINLGAAAALGLVREDTEVSALEAAGRAAGQNLARVRTTISSGLRRGRAKGRAALPPQLQELLEERDRAGLGAPRPPRGVTAAPAPEPLPDTPPPPEADVAALWGRAGSVYDDPPLAAELRARGLDPAAIADADLARALPSGPLPRWAWGPGGSWCASGRRLIVALHDALGGMRSLHARTLRQGLPKDFAKGLSPSGYGLAGLVLACPMGRALLAAGPSASPPGWDGEAWWAEGVPDFLTLATYHSDAAPAAPAVFGYLQGSRPEACVARVPLAACALIFAHDDKTGRKLAGDLAAALAPRPVRFAEVARG